MSDQQPQDVGEHVSLHHLTDPHLHQVYTSLAQYARQKEGEKQQMQESFQRWETRIEARLDALANDMAAMETRLADDMAAMETRLAIREQELSTSLQSQESKISEMSEEISKLKRKVDKLVGQAQCLGSACQFHQSG